MKTTLLKFFALLFSTALFSQAGHIMQGVGNVNMSMGGAATAQPLDISGALHWNPASISTFDDKIIRFDIGFFFSSPELSASLPEGLLFQAGDMGPGSPASPPVFGTTKDDRGVSALPALAMVWGKENSKHTFGASAFGISGFGVTFPQETNLPFDQNGMPNTNWNPNNSNPVTWPQALRGFGHIESEYILLQIGFTWAYEISDKLSFGIQPTFNYANLELMPNPTANPTMAGYPSTNKANATGYGAQFGLFYDSGKGFKAGASYKTTQTFSDFEFDNTYLDNSTGTNSFNMDYPSILSFGLGYSTDKFDFALDYRLVDYENTDGFSETGWTQTGSVAGFGWENISIISAGLQYKGFNKLPLRMGYTYSSNPINSDVAFFNIPATAVIKNAFQLGLSYQLSDRLSLDSTFHYGFSGDATEGQILDPMQVSPTNPLGAIPGTSVSYDMKTSMIMVGVNYIFNKKADE
ncbi:OmpP1/FadL family transporter [Winogradskyella wandonensis]|nr:outer membrane protein transport protein [Winogradskyella wandonensis]